MKRFLSLFLIAALCLSLCACQSKNEKIEKPVNFYYRNAEVSYGTADGLISPKVAESAGYENTAALLNEYLKGPRDSAFDTTFPTGTKVLQIIVAGDTAYLSVNDSLARYTGIDLTIACACLTLTTMELTGASTVSISPASGFQDGSNYISMNMDNLMLLDLYTPETTE